MDDEVIRQVGSFVIGGSMAVAQKLVGTKKSWSWLCVMAVQVMYIVYGFLIDAWGFAFFAVFFIVFVNVPNYIKWRNEERQSTVTSGECSYAVSDGWVSVTLTEEGEAR